jgi:hypothetical protein
MDQPPSRGDRPGPLRQRLVALVVFEDRSLVVQRLGVTAEWRGLEWTDDAACADSAEATPVLCARSPVSAQCLAAAVASDDQAVWRGGLSRGDRECLWAGMERTYRDVRDLELMRLDTTRLADHGNGHRPTGHVQNGHRG